ncbi:MAG: biotin transporter BioY [Candidatus Atribacteria bacterium]|nr:biotin transporter BioY [Candidatus Atribacteria bacterium]
MKISPRTLVRSALLCALAGVAASLIRFGSAVVPFSLLPFVAILAGLVFSPQEAFIGWVGYLLLGLFGVPVFASPPYGGLTYVFKPTFGFLLGFALVSPLLSMLLKKRKAVTYPFLLVLSFLGAFFYYIPGLFYFWFVGKYILASEISVNLLLKIVFWPFIWTDILKALGASMIAWKAMPSLRRGRN